MSDSGLTARTGINNNFTELYGREEFTTAEKTKLSGIETSAEVNPSDAEIKTAYENNADTNAFTDAEQTKLSGIEAGAEVNNISDVNATTLTDGSNADLLHVHTASAISDFDTEVSNNSSVVANTAKISYTDASTVAANSADIDAILDIPSASFVTNVLNINLDSKRTGAVKVTNPDANAKTINITNIPVGQTLIEAEAEIDFTTLAAVTFGFTVDSYFFDGAYSATAPTIASGKTLWSFYSSNGGTSFVVFFLQLTGVGDYMSIGKLIRRYSMAVGGGAQYEVVFNGSDNYIDLDIIPTQTTVLKVTGRFRTNGITAFSGCEGPLANSRYFFGNQAASSFALGTSLYETKAIADTVDHEFEINDGELFIDGVSEIGSSGQSFGTLGRNLIVGALNGSSISLFCQLTIQKIEWIHSGVTYTLNLNEGTGNVVQDNFGTNYTIQGSAVTWTPL